MIDFTIAIVTGKEEKGKVMVEAITDVFQVQVFPTGNALLEYLENNEIDLTLIDFGIQDMSAVELQQTINKDYPDVHTVMITGIDRSKCIVESMKKRAMDYIYQTEDQERFKSDVCKLVRFVIDDKKRYKAESALRETGLYTLIKDIYENRNIDIDEIKKEIERLHKRE